MAALVNKFILTNTEDTESPYVMAVRSDLVSLSLTEVLLSLLLESLGLVLHHFRDTYTVR